MNSPGVALFDSFDLRTAARVECSDWFGLPPGARWLRVANEIAAWTRNASAGGVVVRVVFEKPQWYQRTKSKGDPNDLVGVAGVAANVTGLLDARLDRAFWTDGLCVISPTPAEWIGQLSKVCPVCKGKAKKKCRECHGSAWETPRGRYIRKRLTDAELSLVPDQNDAIDAVGIGLWALGRLTPQRAYSNGRDGL